MSEPPSGYRLAVGSDKKQDSDIYWCTVAKGWRPVDMHPPYYFKGITYAKLVPTRPASPALDRLKELVDGPDGLNWIHAKLKDLYSAAHVDPEQISEQMARDIVRAVHEGGDEILDEFARIKLGLSRALRIIEELKQ